MTPQELALYGALTGAGGYGATRLLHNAMKNVEDAVTPGSSNPDVNMNQITIRLPKKQVPGEQPMVPPIEPQPVKLANPVDIPQMPDTGSSMPMWQMLPVAAGSAGLGYYGAGKIHDFMQRRMAEDQLKKTQQQYQQTLQQLQQSKVASDTPYIDAYCEAMAGFTEELSKSAMFGPSYAAGAPGLFDSAKSGLKSDWIAPIASGLGTIGVLKFLADKTQRMEQDDERNKAKLPGAINIVQQ
jgi:hypothetical protein